jgi:O-antigen ligase
VRSLLVPNLSRPLAAAGKAAGIALFALVFALAARNQPLLAAAVPAVFATAVLCARWPAAAVTLLAAVSGSFGSLEAFGILSAGPFIGFVLAALVVSVLLSHMINRRERPWWLWPGVALLVLYIGITFLEITTAASVSLGFKSFSYQAWYMVLVPLLALAGWRLGTYLRIWRALIAVALLVAGYAVLRQVIGPAASEREFALTSGAGVYNTIGDQLSLLGSFPNRHELAFWVTAAAPLCLAAALLDRRTLWRTAAAVTVALCLVAAFGTGVRAAIPALIAGGGTVIVLNQISGGARGTVLAQTLGAVAVAATAGAFLFALVVGPDSSRYGAILSPSGDPSYEAHIQKWEAAIQELNGHPFGLGLGTAGRLAHTAQIPFVTAGSYSIDSAYLKIAFEQGFPVLALFLIAMIALLIELMRRSVRARSPGVRALAIGAAGSTAAALPMWVSGQYLETLASFMLWIPLGAAIGAIAAERAETEPNAPTERRIPGLVPRRVG